MNHCLRLVILGSFLLAGAIGAVSALKAQPDSKSAPGKGVEPKQLAAVPAEQSAFFEKSIRPVLVRECYSCHAVTAEKIKGGLLLDTREGLRKGGKSGPAIVPGDAKKSLLIQALKHAEEDFWS